MSALNLTWHSDIRVSSVLHFSESAWGLGPCENRAISRDCQNCIRDIGPRLVRDPHQTTHDLTGRHIHHGFLVAYVPEVQRRGSGDGAGLRDVKAIEYTPNELGLRISKVPFSRSLLYSLPMCHSTSPRCLVGIIWFAALTTTSATSSVASIVMST